MRTTGGRAVAVRIGTPVRRRALGVVPYRSLQWTNVPVADLAAVLSRWLDARRAPTLVVDPDEPAFASAILAGTAQYVFHPLDGPGASRDPEHGALREHLRRMIPDAHRNVGFLGRGRHAPDDDAPGGRFVGPGATLLGAIHVMDKQAAVARIVPTLGDALTRSDSDAALILGDDACGYLGWYDT